VPVTNLIIIVITIGGSIFLTGAAMLTWGKDAPRARRRLFAPIPASSRRTSAPRRSLLTISGLSCRYGGIAALKGVDLAVREGEVVTIIGPNGADKSTLLKASWASWTARRRR